MLILNEVGEVIEQTTHKDLDHLPERYKDPVRSIPVTKLKDGFYVHRDGNVIRSRKGKNNPYYKWTTPHSQPENGAIRLLKMCIQKKRIISELSNPSPIETYRIKYRSLKDLVSQIQDLMKKGQDYYGPLFKGDEE